MGGSLTENELLQAARRSGCELSSFDNFIETGTYKGDTTIMASRLFRRVYTMEIVKSLYEASVDRANAELGRNHNISFFLNDSVKQLQRLIPTIKGSSVYFIDAHQSGPDTSNNGKCVPLMEELSVILSNDIDRSLFIFDDVRFWLGKPKQAWDWEHISDSSILEQFHTNGYEVIKHYELNDRFYVDAEKKTFAMLSID